MRAKMYNFKCFIKNTDERYLKTELSKLLTQAGFNIISVQEHQFNPYGYTALYLLSESHFAIHTFPEDNKSYIELSSCVYRQYRDFKILFDESCFFKKV